jgi:hypothetical protein
VNTFLTTTNTTEAIQEDDQLLDLSKLRDDQLKHIKNNFMGIVIKLSTLSKYSISVKEILSTFSGKVIIDAEFDRLDQWLIKQLATKSISEIDLSRLYITVQVKRFDAQLQLQTLAQLQANVILVPGNQHYLSGQEKRRKASTILTKFLQKYQNISMLGINKTLRDKVHKIISLSDNKKEIIELMGFQTIENSYLWAYFMSKEKSDEANAYLQRRRTQKNAKEKILAIETTDALVQVFQQHRVYLFIDILYKKQYLDDIKTLNSLLI